MKKTLLTCIAALFLATGAAHVPAQAAKLVSKEFVGGWCLQDDSIIATPLPPGEEDCKGIDNIMIIKPDRYRGWEHSCTYTEVKTWFDRTISVATKTPLGAWVSRVKSRCGGEGCTWREEMTIYFAKGVLFIKNRRHFAEKCEH